MDLQLKNTIFFFKDLLEKYIQEIIKCGSLKFKDVQIIAMGIESVRIIALQGYTRNSNF